ncbi:protein NLRC3-like isoform X2 [Brienomyrus brachyistius]|uniref:protein NLRC3-like isoform X2 n=1 Tax=Brienomyrus brachyistius TaxID=42636 RepID=UPI0020B29302|nr:protein NLRC3-like isoform X2 [Brienomyrus brachyistius]
MAHHSDEEIQLTPAILLLDYLKNLNDDELKEFKWRLSHIRYYKSKSIPEGQVKDLKERTNVVDLMINFYCEDDAPKVMCEILRQMNQNDLAQKLNNDLQKSKQAGGELDRVTGQCARMQMDQHESGAEDVGEKYRNVQTEFKKKLIQKYQCISEGIAKQGKSTFLIDIYTELYVTEAGSRGVNNEHEIRQIETACWKNSSPEYAIKCSDIFKPLPGQSKHIRTVLTKGIAGIGKTVSVKKFVLDWAEGRENQDIEFIFPLPFHDLNRLKDNQYSLIQLINHFFSDIKEIENIKWNKTVFIFDGLDECRFPLNFNDNEIWQDKTKPTTVDMLLTNLIAGNLLSSALIWITSRPAAANQIPSECVQQLTEVRGFNDSQKEQYFIKRFSDQTMSSKIFAYIRSSRTLFIMCHIPIFCWISATVLERLLGEEVSKEIPQTLTQMYSHFLIIQIITNRKYQGNCMTNSKMLSMKDREIILKLGKLSFHALEKGNLIFYEEDLESCGIEVSEATLYSHLCTEIIIEEWGMYQEKAYRFVHLSLQEYLAALYAFYRYTQEKINVLDPDSGAEEQETLSALHKSAIDKALQSQNGHLDLFLRFILGLSLESNQTFLQGLLMLTGNANWTAEDTVKNIKKMIKEDFSPDRIINLFHCLNELNHPSLVKDIQTYLKTRNPTGTKLKAHQCSALAFVLLMSGEVLDDFDLKTYNASDLGLERLLSVVKHCRRAVLDSCGLRGSSYETVSSALQVTNHLRELNLSYNVLGDSGLRHLDTGLRSPNCRLQKLLLSGCHFTGVGCEVLASALGLNPSCLRELDVSYNDVEDHAVVVLCAKLISLSCKLEKLKLSNCCLTELCCGDLALLLRSASSELRELELRDNDLKDSGVKLLCDGLQDANCKLERLVLSGCRVTEEGCGFLSRALRSNPSHLKELDLSYNHPGDSGLRQISAVQEDPSCGLKSLFVDHCEESRDRPRLQKYFCSISLDPLAAHKCLSLSDKDQKVTFGEEAELYPDHYMQVLSRETLSDRSYWEVRISGVVDVGVAYRGIPALGMSDKSWCLNCFGTVLTACHNRKMTSMRAPGSVLQTLGVYLDHQAGTLSFYSVSSDTITHIHSFCVEFTEPLHAGIRLYPGSSTSASLQPP